MKTAFRISVVLGLSFLFVVVAARGSPGQPDYPKHDAADSAQWQREADFPFSLSRREDVDRLFKVCRIAVLEATLTLEKFERKEYTKHDDEPKQAAKVLIMFRGGGPRGLAALCNSITLQFGGGSEAVPLDNYYIAQALAGIGGRSVRGAIFDSLRQALDRKNLLIRAHVLAQMEPTSIMSEYLRLALEDHEQRERINAVAVNETYKSNLRLMDEWLKDPQFLADIKNWP